MQKQTTLTCPDNAATNVELGFVPDKLIITNRTTKYTLEWNSNLTAGYYYQITDQGVKTLVTSGGPTVIDGSDKTNYVTSSFGFLFPVIANIQDTLNEVLDISAIRNDDV